MRSRRIPTLTLACLLAGALPAAAGDHSEKKKCSTETTVCIREMAAEAERRGWIGIEFTSPEDLTITRVVAGGPAEKAGVEVGDVWTGLADFRFAETGLKESMKRVKKTLAPGAEVAFHLRRGGQELTLTIEPVRVPQHILAQWVGQHVLEGHLPPPAAEPKPPVDGG